MKGHCLAVKIVVAHSSGDELEGGFLTVFEGLVEYELDQLFFHLFSSVIEYLPIIITDATC
jgi:hypothetical protein